MLIRWSWIIILQGRWVISLLSVVTFSFFPGRRVYEACPYVRVSKWCERVVSACGESVWLADCWRDQPDSVNSCRLAGLTLASDSFVTFHCYSFTVFFTVFQRLTVLSVFIFFTQTHIPCLPPSCKQYFLPYSPRIRKMSVWFSVVKLPLFRDKIKGSMCFLSLYKLSGWVQLQAQHSQWRKEIMSEALTRTHPLPLLPWVRLAVPGENG